MQNSAKNVVELIPRHSSKDIAITKQTFL